MAPQPPPWPLLTSAKLHVASYHCSCWRDTSPLRSSGRAHFGCRACGSLYGRLCFMICLSISRWSLCMIGVVPISEWRGLVRRAWPFLRGHFSGCLAFRSWRFGVVCSWFRKGHQNDAGVWLFGLAYSLYRWCFSQMEVRIFPQAKYLWRVYTFLQSMAALPQNLIFLHIYRNQGQSPQRGRPKLWSWARYVGNRHGSFWRWHHQL